ncbi:MAG: sigma-70 family RNA polymerase sigma factor [Bacteroidia bacterium]|nr:sigma-70 family RNA polymerase sigma factor [Bacteroidia bacterium]
MSNSNVHNSAPMNLQELIKGCERSDKDSQRELFDLFKDSMMSLCLRYAKSEQQATEIFKEGFVSVFNNIKNISEQQLESWVRKTMINAAIDVLRRNKQEYKIVSTVNAYDNINQEDKIVDQEVTRTMDGNDVLKAMQALTPAYRVVVNMHLVDDYSIKQISEKLDVGEATIRLNFEKAMHQIRKNIVQLTTVGNAE